MRSFCRKIAPNFIVFFPSHVSISQLGVWQHILPSVVVSHLPEVVDVGLLDVGDVPVPQVVDDPREVDVPRQRPRNVLMKEI